MTRPEEGEPYCPACEPGRTAGHWAVDRDTVAPGSSVMEGAHLLHHVMEYGEGWVSEAVLTDGRMIPCPIHCIPLQQIRHGSFDLVALAP